MFVRCEYCVLSGRGLCDELITRPEESYRLWCVGVGSQRHSKKKNPPEELLGEIRNSTNMQNDSSHVKIASPKLANKSVLII